MPQPSQAVLYMQGTFDLANPTPAQIDQMVAAANQINTLGYTTVILGQWHVHADGSLYYNNSTFNEVINQLKVLVTALKMGRGSVQKVLVTFGL